MHKKAGLFILSSAMLLSLGLGGAGHDPVAAILQPQSPTYVASSIEQWNALRQNSNAPFETQASFLLNHPGWPGAEAMRRAAERAIVPGISGAGDVLRFFAAYPALTPAGHGAHALALRASNRLPEAQAAARLAWTGGALPVETESRLLATFGGGFTAADHDRRADALLSSGDVGGARRVLPLASPRKRAVAVARIAVQGRSAEAPALIAALGAAADRDAGLLMDRASSFNRNGNPSAARQLMAQRRTLDAQPANPERFMELMVTLARGSANDGQQAQAYQIASQVDDIYPVLTDVSRKPYGERDEYTNLTWLAGTTALRNGRAADAVGMFERYGRASQSPQSRTKGIYWAGHSAQLAGRAPQAQTYFTEAARGWDQFYGQLSAERLRQPLPAAALVVVTPSAVERQGFERSSLVAAVRYLGQRGQWTQQSLFVRALAEAVDSPGERQLAADLGRQVGRRDLGVLVSRAGRREGAADIQRWGFPEMSVPAAHSGLWPVIHGIARQESLFDQHALSSAGARGLMQLMPGTAREVAGRIGQPYAPARLTGDPDYNVMLGSAYFSTLMDQWGSYPLAVASYNAGPGNVRRWVRENGDPRSGNVDMVDWIERIPFFETRNYVQRVLENTVVYEQLYPQRARSPATGRLSYYLGRRPG